MTLAEAREKRADARRQKYSGQDPAQLKRELKRLPYRMMKSLAYFLAGFLSATVVAWGALFAWVRVYMGVSPTDSYRDRVPYGADTFLICWLVFSFAAAVACTQLARRAKKSNDR